MQKCKVDSCNREVTKQGHDLCYEHWKALRDGIITQCEECGKYMENDYPLCSDCYAKSKTQAGHNSGTTLSSTAIGKTIGLSAMKVNQILAELGWIEKFTRGWKVTSKGEALGGRERHVKESGVPYVVWPSDILENKALARTVKEYKGEKEEETIPADKAQGSEIGFREKFPAEYRAMDGHMVRSKAEMAIDNFLYVSKIVHAFERKLPIEEEVYCDFYLPDAKVYIEYWGLENDPKYQARKKQKQEIYARNGLNLLELTDEHVRNLDDHLPRMLLKFGVRTES